MDRAGAKPVLALTSLHGSGMEKFNFPMCHSNGIYCGLQ